MREIGARVVTRREVCGRERELRGAGAATARASIARLEQRKNPRPPARAPQKCVYTSYTARGDEGFPCMFPDGAWVMGLALGVAVGGVNSVRVRGNVAGRPGLALGLA